MKKHVQFSTKVGEESITLNVVIDFTEVSQNQILEWAVSNRVIALQRVLRALGPKRAREFEGKIIPALEAGKVPEDPQKALKAAIAALKEVGELEAAAKLEQKLKN